MCLPHGTLNAVWHFNDQRGGRDVICYAKEVTSSWLLGCWGLFCSLSLGHGQVYPIQSPTTESSHCPDCLHSPMSPNRLGSARPLQQYHVVTSQQTTGIHASRPTVFGLIWQYLRLNTGPHMCWVSALLLGCSLWPVLLDKEVGLEIWKEITEDQTDSRDEAGILSKSL